MSREKRDRSGRGGQENEKDNLEKEIKKAWDQSPHLLNVLPDTYNRFQKFKDFGTAYEITRAFAKVFTGANALGYPIEVSLQGGNPVRRFNPNITCTLYTYQLKDKSLQVCILMDCSGTKSNIFKKNIINFVNKYPESRVLAKYYKATENVELFIIDSISPENSDNFKLHQLCFYDTEGNLQEKYSCAEGTSYIEIEKLIQQGKNILGTAHFSVWMTLTDQKIFKMTGFSLHASCNSRCQKLAEGQYLFLSESGVIEITGEPFFKATNFYDPTGYQNISLKDNPKISFILRELSPGRLMVLSPPENIDELKNKMNGWNTREVVALISYMRSILLETIIPLLPFFNTQKMVQSLADRNKLPQEMKDIITQINAGISLTLKQNDVIKDLINSTEETYINHWKKDYKLSFRFEKRPLHRYIICAFEDKESHLNEWLRFYGYPQIEDTTLTNLQSDILKKIENWANKKLENDLEKLREKVIIEMRSCSIKELKRFANMTIKNDLSEDQKEIVNPLKTEAKLALIQYWLDHASDEKSSVNQLVLLAFTKPLFFNQWLKSSSIRINISSFSLQDIEEIERKAKTSLYQVSNQNTLREIIKETMPKWSIQELQAFAKKEEIFADKVILIYNNQPIKLIHYMAGIEDSSKEFLKEESQKLLEEKQFLLAKIEEKINQCKPKLLIKYLEAKKEDFQEKLIAFIKEQLLDSSFSLHEEDYLHLIRKFEEKVSQTVESLKVEKDFRKKISELKIIIEQKKILNIMQLVGKIFLNDPRIDLLSKEEWVSLIKQSPLQSKKKVNLHGSFKVQLASRNVKTAITQKIPLVSAKKEMVSSQVPKKLISPVTKENSALLKKEICKSNTLEVLRLIEGKLEKDNLSYKTRTRLKDQCKRQRATLYQEKINSADLETLKLLERELKNENLSAAVGVKLKNQCAEKLRGVYHQKIKAAQPEDIKSLEKDLEFIQEKLLSDKNWDSAKEKVNKKLQTLRRKTESDPVLSIKTEEESTPHVKAETAKDEVENTEKTVEAKPDSSQKGTIHLGKASELKLEEKRLEELLEAAPKIILPMEPEFLPIDQTLIGVVDQLPPICFSQSDKEEEMKSELIHAPFFAEAEDLPIEEFLNKFREESFNAEIVRTQAISLKEAENVEQIGPKKLDGWEFYDVKDNGNCFYEAMADQLKRAGHKFIEKVPVNTAIPDCLRARAQGKDFKDREWVDWDQMMNLCAHKDLNVIIAILDTRQPKDSQNYSYLYTNKNKDPRYTDNAHKLPQDKFIVKVAFTGNHYLSIIQEPIVQGLSDVAKDAIQSPFLSEVVFARSISEKEFFIADKKKNELSLPLKKMANKVAIKASSVESVDQFGEFSQDNIILSQGFHPAHSDWDIRNSATKFFLDEGSLKFKNWYHPDIFHYLMGMVDNKTKCLRVVFHDADGGNNTTTFKIQLQQLVMLSNKLKRPALFISKEPGADNHFVCGLVKNNKLLLINPLGITAHEIFYQTLADLKREMTIDVWLSSNLLQKEEYEEGIVSCGPITLELATYILTNFSPEAFEGFWGNNLKTNEPIKHDSSGLNYYELNIKDLLSDTLKELLNFTNKPTYQDKVCSIRQKHYEQLRVLPIEFSKSSNIPIENYLEKCKEAPDQVVFTALITGKNILTIDELPEYKLLEHELKLQPESTVLPQANVVESKNPQILTQQTLGNIIQRYSKIDPQLQKSPIKLSSEESSLFPLKSHEPLSTHQSSFKKALSSYAKIIQNVSLLSKTTQKIPYTFLFKSRGKVGSVSVMGSFNDWSPHAKCVMKEYENNIWKVTLLLESGTHQFKYLVNNQEWVSDPNCPTTQDKYHNSILEVEDPSQTMEHTFIFPHSNFINSVHLAGTFNHWLLATDSIIKEGVISNQYQMKKGEDNIWRLKVSLPEGQHEFKYVVNRGMRWICGVGYDCHQNGVYTNSVIDIHLPKQTEENVDLSESFRPSSSNSDEETEENISSSASQVSQFYSTLDSIHTSSDSEGAFSEEDEAIAEYKTDIKIYRRHDN